MASPQKGPSLHVVPAKTAPRKFVVKEAGNPTPITRPATQVKTQEKAIPGAEESPRSRHARARWAHSNQR